ncbi:MAG: UDP-N-acetylmuramoyl-L-alanine--D-glutamate ligase [Pseudomonadota bacterium]
MLELSSYQLDLCPTLALDIAIFLNISPDHLDRHGTMENYIESKKRIFRDSKVQIIGTDDDYSRDVFSATGGLSISKSFGFPNVDNPNLRGDHNAQNMAAVLMAARELGLDDDEITAALNSYPGLPHRQFMVREISGIQYINDSKATNAEAAGKALGAYDDIYWIAGGRAKEGGLEGLEEFMPKIRHAFLIGEAAKPFADWLEDKGIPCSLCGKLEVAIETAHNAAQGASASGESGVVLLSPACASFDQYPSFEVRGEEFQKLVEKL